MIATYTSKKALSDLERLGKKRHGHDWKTPISQDLGVSRQAVFYWHKQKRVPDWALVTIHQMTQEAFPDEASREAAQPRARTVTKRVEVTPPALDAALEAFFEAARGKMFDDDMIPPLKNLRAAHRSATMEK